ncbi:MAG: LysM peptidoglycan-binding domain-containing protein [Chloroflexi bacterium]|nr:LysM peptidoglycan-binding domain-containing protein [Chloroflexota bacterium]
MIRWLRQLVLLLLVVAVFAGLALLMLSEDKKRQQEAYRLRVTMEVQTAVAYALYDATRTAESSLSHYRLVRVAPDEALADVAARYNTTLDVVRMANGLLPDVEFGNGEAVIIPEGVQFLNPPRRFQLHTALVGDTLDALSKFYDVPLDLLKQDNPVLASRGLIPGDIVFIPIVLTAS